MSDGVAILVLAALLLGNGFFVAAEFALVKLRHTQAVGLAERHGWRGRLLLNAPSVAQVRTEIRAEKDADKAAAEEAKAEKKRDRARRLFAAIDANAGGKLAKKPGKPDAEAILIALANKPMVIRLGEYEGRTRDGGTTMRNYVQAVAPKTEETYLPPPKERPASRPAPRSGAPAGGMTFDDEIPFAPEWRG